MLIHLKLFSDGDNDFEKVCMDFLAGQEVVACLSYSGLGDDKTVPHVSVNPDEVEIKINPRGQLLIKKK